MYQLEFLPTAQRDLIEIVQYISRELNNPASAKELAGELISSAEKLRDFPYMYPVYYPIRALKREYRKLPVKNYLLFYWVDEQEKTITVARVIYARRNYSNLLR